MTIYIYPYKTCTPRVIRVDFKFEASHKMHRAVEHQSVAEGRHRIRLCPAHLGVHDSCDSNPGVSLQNGMDCIWKQIHYTPESTNSARRA